MTSQDPVVGPLLEALEYYRDSDVASKAIDEFNASGLKALWYLAAGVAILDTLYADRPKKEVDRHVSEMTTMWRNAPDSVKRYILSGAFLPKNATETTP